MSFGQAKVIGRGNAADGLPQQEGIHNMSVVQELDRLKFAWRFMLLPKAPIAGSVEFLDFGAGSVGIVLLN